MNIQFTKSFLKVIGAVLILITLMSIGLFFYARWDLKRFKESLGEVPEVSPIIVSQTEKVATTHAEEASPAEIVVPKPLTQHHIELESKELGMDVSSLETLDSPMDELSLYSLYEVGLSEEETTNVQSESLEKEEASWVDEFQEEIGSGDGAASLIASLESDKTDIGSGNSEDVATVVEMLKRSTEGPITVDDLITMTEAWLRIQPDTPHVHPEISETRAALENRLARLRADKEESLQNGEEKKYMFYVY